MSEGWRKVALSAVADILPSNVDKKTYPGEQKIRLCNYLDVYTHNYISDDIDFMEATATPNEIRKYHVDRGDVLVTKDSETPDDIGIPAVVIDDIRDLVCGYHLALLRPDHELVDSIFLAKQLANIESSKYFGNRANGSTRYGLSYGSIATAPIYLAPITQQRRIAEILYTIDIAIEQTEALIAKMQQIKAGLMHDLFTRGIMPNGQLRPTREEAPHFYKESPLGWIPKEWEVDSWSNLVTSWAMGPRFSADEYSETGNVATMRTTDMDQDGNLNYDTMPRANLDLSGLRQHLLQPNDFVISRSGTCGIAAMFEGYEIPVIPGAFLVRFRFGERINPITLRSYINSPIGSRPVSRIAEGGVQKNLRGTALGKIVLPVPSRAEQQQMSNILDAVYVQMIREKEKLSNLFELKSGLMHDLLTGRVRVPEALLKKTAATT